MPFILTAHQRAILYAEAFQSWLVSNPADDQAKSRRRFRIQYSVLKNALAENAERLLSEFPIIAAEVKAGRGSIPLTSQDWEKLAQPQTTMDLKTINAIKDLLDPAEFAEFKNVIREEIRHDIIIEANTTYAVTAKENRNLRKSIANLWIHAKNVAAHYGIDSLKEGDIPTTPNKTILDPAKIGFPPIQPITISDTAPEKTPKPVPVEKVVEKLRAEKPPVRFPKHHKPGTSRAHPVMPSQVDIARRKTGTIAILKLADKNGLNVDEIIAFLGSEFDFPIDSTYNRTLNRDGETRIRTAVRNIIYHLNREKKLISCPGHRWRWITQETSLNTELTEALCKILLDEKLSLEIVHAETSEILIPANQKITKTHLQKVAVNHDHLVMEPSPIRNKIYELINALKNKFNSK
jgi:hypothetical protein